MKKLDLAAATAHTFFVANPTHLQMREDMAKYRRMSGVRPQSFRDLETPPYWAAYDTGLELLGRQEAALALPWLEEALQESLAQVESCRAGCEGPEEQQKEEEEEGGTGSQGGLYEAIAGHWIGVVQCRQRCVEDTATRPGRSFPVPDFLPGQLRQLHEAHAQVGNLSQAVENVLSVLLFYPEDEAARKALDQYQAQLGEPRPALGPREVAPPHSPREVARNQTGEQAQRMDLSHPVHADNSESAIARQAQVRPRCGRLVAFSSGVENPHGEWTEAKELLQEPEKEEGEEMPSRDPAPEPPSPRLQRVQDKAGKPPRVREEL
ncbi:hypothetical protein E2I00_015137 [Balaenoptera physalus]|uniref:Leprecan-like alpha-helical domain-containing protein n=1 Tax=Balaenoptera physalus TaxID=9770 RepID=A0A643CBV6_BALPH|nr:hypothetical protein E2I00_015137 [Balaenoptera physalus]